MLSEPHLYKPLNVYMDIWSMHKCPFAYVGDVCWVSELNSNSSWFVRSTKRWRIRANKTPIYLVILPASTMICHLLTRCIWNIKSIEIVTIHLWKMPLKYWGMVPSLNGPLGLQQSGVHHGPGHHLPALISSYLVGDNTSSKKLPATEDSTV